ncbi:uncharacterized protein LOC122951728 isoform X2 [Acropora millepora]|uniref:uncharacterized protein LOC122951728 isoform X2 n=1 Tax=Acropora millepora TaxID=45264 RepID=UPI001CF186CF|nr:uncharacterized protein LOC122951728 isoform X2 [Acropora millepora]
MKENLESKLNKAKDHIQFLKASSFEELVAQFQLQLFRHYNNEGPPLYDLNEMEAFAPALFPQILKPILNNGMSKDKQDTQRRRTVALMHILAYFRSQKTSQLQKQSGLNAQLSGMSLTGLAAGPILPKSLSNLKRRVE